MSADIIETHPWQPFVPENARVLLMGTFPPGKHRWSMDFFYPNRSNDFWYMIGLLFFGDRRALYDESARAFRLDDIKTLLTEKGIALYDSCRSIRRLRGNASDRFLEVVEPVDLQALLRRIPLCRDVASTGEKAASVIASVTSTEVPPKGGYITTGDGLRIWRMPSTSRAYPLPLEQKTAYYAELFRKAGISCSDS